MKLKKTRYAFLFAALVASAQAQTNLFWGGGTADITNGTPLPSATVATTLNGNWDATTKNWSTDPTTTVYQTYSSAADVSLGLVGAGTGDPGSAAITLASGSNFTFGGRLYGSLWGGTGFNQAFNLNTASGIATVTLGGSSAVLDFTNSSAGNTAVRGIAFGSNAAGTNSVRLAGSAQMIIRGGSRVSMNSDSSGYTGAVRVENGNLALGSSFGAATNANLNGATSFDIRNVDVGNGNMTQQSSLTNAMPLLTVSYGSNTFSNVIKDTANITLRGGQMTFRGIRDVATPTNEIAGGLTLDSWGYLDLATLSGGTAGVGLDSQLTFASGLARTGTRDAMLVGVNSTGTLNTSKVTLTGGSTTYGNNLLAWATTTRAEFLKINASDVLEVIASTSAATDLGTWASTYNNTSNIRVGNSTAFAPTNTIGNTTVNSLGLFPSGTTTLAQASGTTLTIQSGGISYQAGGAVTISGGTITTGTPASTPLYINAGSGAGNKLTITSVIAGANMDFVKSGLADVEFATGAGLTDNTFTGTTYVNGGLLTLNRQDSTAAANRISVPGNLVINNGGRVGVSRGGQFAASSSMTVNEGGMLNLSGGGVTTTGTITINGGRIQESNQGFTANGAGNGLVFNGGSIVSNTGFPTANTLGTNVEYQSTAATTAVWEQLQGFRTGSGAQNWDLALGTAARTFTIANSSTLVAGTPEMTIGARITSGTGGKIIKAGDGVLRLIGSAANDGTTFSGTNTYTGGTDVTNGSLIVGYNASNPAVTANAVVGNNNGMVVFEKPVNLIVGQKLNGQDNFVASIISPTQVLMTSSTGLTTSNTRAALTFSATVARSGSLGTGAVSINGGTGTDAPALLAEANISIGNAITVGNTGSSRTIGGSSTSGTAIYTSNIVLNGAATLVAATGGTVAFQTGAWTSNNNAVNIGGSGNDGIISLGNALVTTGGITVNSGTLSPASANRFSSATPLTVSGGTLALGGSNQTAGTVTLVSGAITGSGGILTGTGSDFDVRSGSASAILGGTVGLTKSTAGTVTLAGANTYSGATLISGGTLALGAAGSIDNTTQVSLGTVGTFDVTAKGIGGYTTGTLTGSGNVVGALSISTQLNIGNSPGTVNFSSHLSLGSASTYLYDLTGGLVPGAADLGDIAGNLTIDNLAVLDLVQLGTYTAGNKFTLFAYDGVLAGNFSGLLDGATFTDAGGSWMIAYADPTAGTNGGVSTSNTYVTITAVPEPGIAGLFGGLGVLTLLRRRRSS